MLRKDLKKYHNLIQSKKNIPETISNYVLREFSRSDQKNIEAIA